MAREAYDRDTKELTKADSEKKELAVPEYQIVYPLLCYTSATSTLNIVDLTKQETPFVLKLGDNLHFIKFVEGSRSKIEFLAFD